MTSHEDREQSLEQRSVGVRFEAAAERGEAVEVAVDDVALAREQVSELVLVDRRVGHVVDLCHRQLALERQLKLDAVGLDVLRRL